MGVLLDHVRVLFETNLALSLTPSFDQRSTGSSKMEEGSSGQLFNEFENF